MSLIALLLIALPSTLFAATWTVEKDGSGDFTIIQEALDAAASGDSILVGPGRFDTFRSGTMLLDGSPLAAIVWVRKPDITLIGAGQYSTIVGPAVHVEEFEGVEAAALLVDYGTSAVIRGFGVENAKFEVTLYGQSLVEDMRVVRGPSTGSYAVWVGYSSGTILRRLEVIGPGGFSTVAGASDLLLEDSHFEDTALTDYAIHMGNGVQRARIRNCTIDGAGGGIQYAGTGEVEDCTLTNIRVVGLEVTFGGLMVARRCVVGETRIGVKSGIGRLELYECVLEGGTQQTLYSTAELYVRNCHLLNAGGMTVLGNTSAAGEFNDLRHNWWGTSDPAQIEAWILDEEGTVLWEPFNDMPIPTETESVSRLKSKFGSN